MINEDELIQHSDAMLAAIGTDGSIDEDAWYAAAAAVNHSYGQLVLTWANVLAHTHDRAARPLDEVLEGIPDEAERGIVRRHGRALINNARVANTSESAAADLYRRWVTILETVDDGGISSIVWAFASAVKPVLDTVGGLNRLTAGLAIVNDVVPSELARTAGGPVGAALCAVAAGHLDAAARYLCIPDIREAFGVLISLAPHLMRKPGASVITLDPYGNPLGIVEHTDDADSELLREVVAALSSGNRDRIQTVARSVNNIDGDRFLGLTFNLTVSLGHQIGNLFTRIHHRETR